MNDSGKAAVTTTGEGAIQADLKQSYVLSGYTFFEPATEPEKSKLKTMLIGILAPRDIPEFMDSVKTELTAYDKLWVRYYQQRDNPYSVLRRGFMKHSNKSGYTHLAILPDDLIVTREGVDKLASNVASNPKEYKVMMGCCNTVVGSKYLAISKNLPSLTRKLRVYQWYSNAQLKGKGIMKVKHAGTPFAILSRKDVLEKAVMLETDKKWNPGADVGYSEDVVLSQDLAKRKIPLYVDTSVNFTHLKESERQLEQEEREGGIYSA